ncbi:MAG: sel1 repeat family protein [Burkholderiaceae bacterium]|nr:sel1 repeat family protein [Burkholderiaceae bacterium]
MPVALLARKLFARTMITTVLSLAIVDVAADPLQDASDAVNRKDYPTAVRLLEPLARQGVASAQLRLGLLYYHGHGVRESDAAALQWFERAARQGLAEAQYHLGNMYAYGLADLPPETDASRLAAQWYFEAARSGHPEAQYSLGILFLTGSGVEQSEAEARKWIARAAAQGHRDAIAYLGALSK